MTKDRRGPRQALKSGFQMSRYIHKVQYYETDKMGITHHSNYIRFMEEARMRFLDEIGYPMRRLEADGIASPVVSVECAYKRATTYDDLIEIAVRIEEYNGVKLRISYEMRNAQSGEEVATAGSTHCFIDEKGRPVILKKHFPELDALFRQCVAKDGE